MNKNNQIKGVIFDMDGVIVNTQHLHDQANVEIIKSYGVDLTPEFLSTYAGVPQKKVFEDIFTKYNIKADINKAIDDKWQLVNEKTKKLEPIDGVIEFIQNLYKNNFSLAVASSSRKDFIDRVLISLKITPYFSVVFSGHDLKYGKPYPDIFLETVKHLNIKPYECIVIEDAPNGVKAAKSAHMKCIAITTTNKKENLKKADKIIKSFNELTVENICNL